MAMATCTLCEEQYRKTLYSPPDCDVCRQTEYCDNCYKQNFTNGKDINICARHFNPKRVKALNSRPGDVTTQYFSRSKSTISQVVAPSRTKVTVHMVPFNETLSIQGLLNLKNCKAEYVSMLVTKYTKQEDIDLMVYELENGITGKGFYRLEFCESCVKSINDPNRILDDPCCVCGKNIGAQCCWFKPELTDDSQQVYCRKCAEKTEKRSSFSLEGFTCCSICRSNCSYFLNKRIELPRVNPFTDGLQIEITTFIVCDQCFEHRESRYKDLERLIIELREEAKKHDKVWSSSLGDWQKWRDKWARKNLPWYNWKR